MSKVSKPNLKTGEPGLGHGNARPPGDFGFALFVRLC
jgi:hypothetical protein